MARRNGSAGGHDHELGDAYRSLSPWLQRRLAVQFGPGRHDIEDLVQESFIRLGRYTPDERAKHPRTLLLRIAGNLARDAFRYERSRGAGYHDPVDIVAAVPMLTQQAEQPANIALKQAILALPEGLRDVFLLSRFTPMTNVEIARHLDISVKTVEWRLAKAVAFCLERLAD